MKIIFLLLFFLQSAYAIDLYPECRAEIIENYSNIHKSKLPELKNWTSSFKNENCKQTPEIPSRISFELLVSLTNDINTILNKMPTIHLSKKEIGQIRTSINMCQERIENNHKLALEAAYGVYTFTVPKGYKISNYVQLNSKIQGTSGLKMYILVPVDENSKSPFILSFAGTKDIRDAISDLHFGSDQMADMAGLINSSSPVLEYLKNGRDLIITGHSLGGGLAQAASTLLIQKIAFQEATDKKFNDTNFSKMGKIQLVSFNAFGGEKLTKYTEQNEVARIKKIDMLPEKVLKSLEMVKTDIYYRGMKSKLEESVLSQSVHYRMKYDVVSKLGTHYGELRTINTKFMNPLAAHRIEIIKNELNAEDGFKNISVEKKNLGVGNWTTDFANRVFQLKEDVLIESYRERDESIK